VKAADGRGRARRRDDYVLGSAGNELRRLQTLSLLYRDVTRRWLERAGIGPGMSVVDVGCGPGDVTLLVGDLVGPTGSVTGVDSSPEALARARTRAEAAGLRNVRYEVGDLASWSPEGPVDAVVGRLILMHMPDPVAVLARMAGMVRPGGVAAFQDIVLPTRRTEPDLPLVGTFNGWLLETLRRFGRPVDMGLRLSVTFREAGLPSPGLATGAPMERGPDALGYSLMAGDVTSLIGHMERLGVATAVEVGPQTFESRLRAEAAETDAVLANPLMVGAWARIP
jgi:SAM-dependent methyltransferase